MPSILSMESMENRTALSPQIALQLQAAEIGLQLATQIVPLLRGLSLSLDVEKVYYLTGENGSGKTTFLRTLLREIPLISGTMKWFLSPVAIGYMPQHLALSPVIPATVEDILLYKGDRPSKCKETRKETRKKTAKQQDDKDIRHRAPEYMEPSLSKDLIQDWIDRLGLRALLKRRYAHLSMGQQKRVLFGRAMSSVPRFLILDEPLANLDLVSKEIIQDILSNYCRGKKSVC